MNATSATFRREALNSATETRDGKVSRSSMSNTEHRFADPNRHVVEVPASLLALMHWCGQWYRRAAAAERAKRRSTYSQRQ